MIKAYDGCADHKRKMEQDKISWPGWEVVRKIGSGSFGAVYEIRRDVFGREERAALKVLSIPESQEEVEELYTEGYDEASITTHYKEHLGEIVREYSLMLDMKGHTNVVYCDDLKYLPHEDGIGWDIYIKMELLIPLMKAVGSEYSEAQTVRMGIDLCNALILCKQANIVHRDIKPQNIFVSKTGDYKLGDFGVAKVSEKTTSGTKVGTFEYMAPEVYRGQPYGSGADIYSLGMVLYWMMNQKRTPFLPLPPQIPSATVKEESRNRRFQGEPLPEPVNGSEALKAIVLKACAFDPKERYASAADMQADLKKLNVSGVSAPCVAEESMDPARDEGTVNIFGGAVSGSIRKADTAGSVRREKAEEFPKDEPEERTVNIFAGTANGTPHVADHAALKAEKKETKSQAKIIPEEQKTPIRNAAPASIPVAAAPAGKVSKKKKGIIPAVIGALVVLVILILALRSCNNQTQSSQTEPSGSLPPQTESMPKETNPPEQTENKDGTQAPSAPVTFDVPDVTEKDHEAAEKMLKDAGFQVNVEEEYSSGTIGTVIRQEPEAGTKLEQGSVVSIWVSLGKQEVSVKLDPCGGKIGQETIKVNVSDPYGNMPEPTRDGYTFLGWFTAEKDGEQILESSVVQVSEVHTLYARWATDAYKITFDANGGSLEQASKTVEFGSAYGTLPTPTKTGYGFAGWYTAKDGGERVTSDTKLEKASNVTLYARWSANAVTVGLDGNGGSVSTSSISVEYGSKYGSLPTPTRNGYTFTGWYTKASGGDQVKADTKVTNSSKHTLYAHWKAVSSNVTFDANGGSVGTSSSSVEYGSKYGSLPTPTRSGYTFTGWYTKASGGDQVTADTKVTSSAGHTLYAHWKAVSYTVSLDANGGNVGTSKISVEYGTAYSALPTPTRTGYTFNGWYTAAGGGSKVTTSTQMTTAKDHTLYAQWQATSYSVKWNDVSNCTIKVNRTGSPAAGAATGSLNNGATVYYGDTLTVTYTAATGYEIKNQGSTSITVSADVTASQIYASVSARSYTYNVVYKSTNGTALGTTTVTAQYGSTVSVEPKTFSGYDTPAKQSVKWDSTTAKTITFTYKPASVAATQTLFTGKTWWSHDGKARLTYGIKVEYRNRTATTVQVRVTWTNTIVANYYYGYKQTGSVTVGNASTGTMTIATSSKFSSSSSSARNASVTSGWITVNVSATTTSVAVSGSWKSGVGTSGNFSGYKMSIPAY